MRAAKEERSQSEREHALRWVRLTVEDHVELVTMGVVRAVVAVADAADDKLRGVFLETLCELCKCTIPQPGELARNELHMGCFGTGIRAPKLVAETGGIRTLTSAIVDNLNDQGSSYIQALLSVLDRPSTRLHIRIGMDLDVCASLRSACSA